MSFSSRLRRLFALCQRRLRPARRGRPDRLRLIIECLERRELLSGTVVAFNQTAFTPAGQPVAVSVLTGDSSSDGSPLSLSSFGGAAHGATTLDPTYPNVVDYTPAAGFTGNDSFVYQAINSSGASASATVFVTVGNSSGGPANGGPVALNQSAATQAGTAVLVNVLGGDYDPDGDPVFVANLGPPAHGTTALAAGNGNVTYTPAAGFSGSDRFTYTVGDGHGGSSTGNVLVYVSPPSPANQQPVANPDSATVIAGQSVTINVLANDSDPDYDPLTVTAIGTKPSAGTATVNADSTITYTANPGQTGSDYFTYTISDGRGGTATAGVTITITASTPVISAPATAGVAENTYLVFSTSYGDAVSVTNVGATQAITVYASVSHGLLNLASAASLTSWYYQNVGGPVMTSGPAMDLGLSGPAWAVNNALNGLTYTPFSNYAGNDNLNLWAGNSSNSAQYSIGLVNVNVIPVDLPPSVTAPASQYAAINTALVFGGAPFANNAVQVQDADANGGVESVYVQASHGQFTLGATAGLTAFSYQAAYHLATLSGTIASLNAALTGLTYVPDGNYSGAEAIYVGINDNGNSGLGGPKSATAVIAVTVEPPPAFAVPATQGVARDTYLTLSPSLANGISVSDPSATSRDLLTVVAEVANGALAVGTLAGLYAYYGNGTTQLCVVGTVAAVNNALSWLVYTPAAGYEGADQVLLWATPTANTLPNAALIGTGLLNINVLGWNHAPTVSAPASLRYTAATPAVFSTANGDPVTVADADAGGGAEQLTLSAGHGALTLGTTAGLQFSQGTGSGDPSITFTGTLSQLNAALDGLRYQAAAGYTLAGDTLTVTINDLGHTGLGGSLSRSTAVVLWPLGATGDAYSVDRDFTLAVPAGTGVLANDVDVNPGTLTAQLVSNAGHGMVTLQAGGSFTYVPATGYTGTDAFTYRAVDGAASSAPATVTITVTPPQPVAPELYITANAGSAALVNLLAGQEATTTVTGIGAASEGIAALNPGGTATYTPDAGATAASDSFGYSIADAFGRSASGTVHVFLTTQAPAAQDIPVVTTPGQTVTVPLLADAYVPAGETVTVIAIGTPAHGTASLDPETGILTYTADGGTTADSDALTYTISNGRGGTSTATVKFAIVQPTVDAPSAADVHARTTPGTPVTVSVLDSDWDPAGGTLTVVAVGTPSDGAAQVNDDGTIAYTPDSTTTAAYDRFTYTIQNAAGAIGTGTITVALDGGSGAGPDDGPVAADVDVTTPAGQTVTINVLGRDSDPAGYPLSVVSVSQPQGGTAVLEPDGTIDYTPRAGTLEDHFTYTIGDGSAITASALVTVAASGQPSSLVLKQTEVYESTDNDRIAEMDLLADVQAPAGVPLTLTVVSAPTHGQLAGDPATGVFSYIASGDKDIGIDQFSFTITDGVNVSPVVTVTILYFDSAADPTSPTMTAFPVAGEAPPFGAAAGPVLGGIAQGAINDCWFVAAAAALTAKRPNDINNMITVNADGTYTVRFPGESPVTITSPVGDGDNWSSANGEWLSVLEKAYGLLVWSEYWRSRNSYSCINRPGLPREGIAALTGSSVESNTFSFTWDSTTATNLSTAFDNNKLVTAVTLVPERTDLINFHVYTVLNWDRAGARVELRNPHGRPDAKFWLSLRTFTWNFSQIAYEQ